MEGTIITKEQKIELFKLMEFDESMCDSEYEKGCRDELNEVLKHILNLYDEYKEWKGENEHDTF